MREPRKNSAWSAWALDVLRQEAACASATPLIRVALIGAPGIDLYIKDESRHPTGSLKHRLARSLFVYAICNGWIDENSAIVEASSGSTAISEAYFARLLGLAFIAVVPVSTAAEKVALIEEYGGQCRKVADPRAIYEEANRIASETGGRYLDQFTHAERVTDWRRGNVAAELLEQMRGEPHPVPRWIVCGAGTGGTSAMIGRHLRYAGLATSLCVADPLASVFHRHYADRAIRTVDGPPSVIEGIGRQRLEPSFIPDVVDRMIPVADADGIAAARHLHAYAGMACGPSTGVNIHACMDLAGEMQAAGQTGAIVTLLGDSAERYRSTCFDEGWTARRGLACGGHRLLHRFMPLEGARGGGARTPCNSIGGAQANTAVHGYL